jgi:hypothetical protein
MARRAPGARVRSSPHTNGAKQTLREYFAAVGKSESQPVTVGDLLALDEYQQSRPATAQADGHDPLATVADESAVPSNERAPLALV